MKAAMSALDANTLPKPKTHSKAVALARRVEVHYATKMLIIANKCWHP